MGWMEDVKQGKLTDIYFKRSQEILKKEGVDPYVTMEVVTHTLPDGYKWAVFTGVSEVLSLLEGLPVDVYGFEEGEILYPEEPVLTIKGRYSSFGAYETPILGMLCQASGITTKALRCRVTAGEKTLLSFGARRMHPSISTLIDRYAYMGGVDGISVIKSAEELGIKPTGTIPHALILILGDTVKALLAFDRVMDEGIPRIALIDTFGDEKFEAIRVAEALKEKLYGIRLDTPRSRRGDLKRIVEEIRQELGIRGYGYVKIFASGGLDEYKIKELSDVVDGFGVGTSLSNARTIDFSMDIVEIEGKPVSKKGKSSGMKEVYHCMRCGERIVVPSGEEPACPCGGKIEKVTQKLMENGRIMMKWTPEQVRGKTLKRVRFLSV